MGEEDVEVFAVAVVVGAAGVFAVVLAVVVVEDGATFFVDVVSSVDDFVAVGGFFVAVVEEGAVLDLAKEVFVVAVLGVVEVLLLVVRVATEGIEVLGETFFAAVVDDEVDGEELVVGVLVVVFVTVEEDKGVGCFFVVGVEAVEELFG